MHVVEKMAHGFKRPGRAAGAGFYQYTDDEPPELWSGLTAFKRRAANVPSQDIRDRLLFAMALEARRRMGSGGVDSQRLADIVSLYGCGFPLHSRGAASFGTGPDSPAFDARCQELAAKYGERFLPKTGHEPPAGAHSHHTH
ncbi:MAG TPA: hypothetical protein VN324_12745 [Quisquiliibacterium sp.]|nr:hypothetical protein [Quisquiliibacterium sp.]